MPKFKNVKPFIFPNFYHPNLRFHMPTASRFERWAFARPIYSSPSSETAPPESTEGACPELIDGLKGWGFRTPFLPFKRISTFLSASSSFWLQNRDSRIPSSKSFKDSSKGISPSSNLETIFSSLLRASSNLSFGIAVPFWTASCLSNFRQREEPTFKHLFYIFKPMIVKTCPFFQHHRADFL